MSGNESQIPVWVQMLAALLTPTVAIIAVVIGLWQARTARLKLRLELFDKRYAVYDAIQQLVGKRLTRGKLKMKDEIEFLSGIDRAKLLFEPDDASAAMDAWKSVSRLDALEATYPAADGPERTAHAKRIVEANGELRALLDGLPSRFSRYLDFTQP